MKTLKLKNRKINSLVLVVIMMISLNSFADGDRPSCAKTANENKLSEMAYVDTEALSIMSPASKEMLWMLEEAEPELEVLDYTETLKMRPLWTIEAMEVELEVENVKPTEEVIPYWMIIETEPELEVTDLAIK